MPLNGIQTMQREEKYIIKPITKKREIRMNTFSDYNDLHRFVSDRLPEDESVYGMNNDQLTLKGADNLEERLKYTLEFDFLYGQELPKDWFEILFGRDGETWFNLFD